MSLNANALTTVADCKLQLEIPLAETSQDPLLEKYINAASSQIERFCGRKFKQATATETLDGTGKNELILPRRPVTAVSAVFVDTGREFDAETELEPSAFAVVDEFILRRHNGYWPRGSQVVRVTYTAGFAEVPSDVDLAAVLLVEYLFRRKQDRRSGRMSISKGGESVSFADSWPPVVVSLLEAWVLPDAGRANTGGY